MSTDLTALDKAECPSCHRLVNWPCEECLQEKFDLCEDCDFKDYLIERLEAQNKKMRKALEFYADDSNWEWQWGDDSRWVSLYIDSKNEKLDVGETARQCLKEIGKEK